MSVHPSRCRTSASGGRSPRLRPWSGRAPLDLRSRVRVSLGRMAAGARRQLWQPRLCSCGAVSPEDSCSYSNDPVDNNGRPASHTRGTSVASPVKTPRVLLGDMTTLSSPLPSLVGAGGSRTAASSPFQPQGLVSVDGQLQVDDDQRNSFEEAMRMAVTIAQMFCTLPVRAGRRSRLARTMVILMLILAMTVMSAVRLFLKEGVNLTSSASVVFYFSSALSLHLLYKLSLNWPQLSSRWTSSGAPLIEDDDEEFRKCDGDVRPSRTIILVMLFVALIEHVLSILEALIPLLSCKGGSWVVYKSFVINKFPMIFDFFPFSVPASIVVLYVNITCTFLWNFVDIVVITFSLLLSVRFKRFNKFLIKAKWKDHSILWWKEVREAYNRLSILTKHVDAQISHIVLLSFASNLYFICLQLLNNMTHEKHDGVFARLYFYFSFAWLMARAAFVSMSAASVYEESVVPVDILYCVPLKSFCVEVQRFLVQTTTDTLALTGCRFFWVTRSLVLTLAGTVVTYEIVLVQYHSGKVKTEFEGPQCFP